MLPEEHRTMNKMLSAAIVAALAMAGVGRAHAAQGDWVVKVGVHTVDPKSDNGTLANGAFKVDVGNDTQPTITAEYMFTPNLGFEVLASTPFKHTVRLNGVKSATFKHLPPTFSLQYHFNPDGGVSPFIGAGVNYTYVFNEHTTGPLAGTRLSVNDSFNVAAHAGVDFRINPKWLFTVDARWIKLDAKAKVNGVDVGTVKVDPLVYGVAVGYRF
jgi:outer membrane protein